MSQRSGELLERAHVRERERLRVARRMGPKTAGAKATPPQRAEPRERISATCGIATAAEPWRDPGHGCVEWFEYEPVDLGRPERAVET